MSGQTWAAKDFARRSYGIEGDDLDKAKRISVTVKLDNRVIAAMQLREPGMLVLLSRPDEQGVRFEIIEPGGARFTDYVSPSGDARTPPLEPWQVDALLGEKK